MSLVLVSFPLSLFMVFLTFPLSLFMVFLTFPLSLFMVFLTFPLSLFMVFLTFPLSLFMVFFAPLSHCFNELINCCFTNSFRSNQLFESFNKFSVLEEAVDIHFAFCWCSRDSG
ncbi:hypothetical protein P9112_005507 [Eukaryota sp. TZLM1-RC]